MVRRGGRVHSTHAPYVDPRSLVCCCYAAGVLPMAAFFASACVPSAAECTDCAGFDAGAPESGNADSAAPPDDSAGESGGPATDCPDPGPVPGLVSWGALGPAPAAGLATLATNGLYPVYLGSTLSGMWRLAQPDAPSWEVVGSHPTSHTTGDVVVAPDNPLRLYRSAGGRLTRSEDGGGSWRELPFGDRGTGSALDGHTYGIAVPRGEPNTVYALLDTGVFGVSRDLGESWEARGLVDLGDRDVAQLDYYGRVRVLAGATGADPIVLHDGRYVWQSEDEGATWLATLESPGNADGLVRDPANLGWLVAPGGWASVDAGKTWEVADLGRVERAWWGDRLWVYGEGELRVGTLGGVDSRPSPTDAPTALAAIGDRVWVTDPTRAWYSADGGLSWTEYFDSLVETNFVVVRGHPVCPGVAWAGTRCDGGVYKSENWGSSWDWVDVGGHYVMDVVFDPTDSRTIWLVNDDSLLVSRDDGATWSTQWQAYHFHGLAFDPADHERMLIGSVGSGSYADSSGNIYLSGDGGLTWMLTAGIPQNSASAHSITFLEAGIVLAGFYLAEDASHLGGEGIGMYRSIDGGLIWVAVDFPHPNIAGITYSEGVAWAAAGDGLYRSIDAGQSWARVLDGWCFWVDMQGPLGFAVFEDSVVYRTEDGGSSWSESHPYEEDLLFNALERVDITAGAEFAWWSRYHRGVYGISL